MNKEVKQLWVKALRSTEFKQGRSKLKSGDAFCCSGVLTELYRVSSENSGIDWERGESFGGRARTLCPQVMNWAGITNTQMFTVHNALISKYPGTKPFMLLPDLNDAGVSFEDLASLIEAQL